jgi:hypothetical protein
MANNGKLEARITVPTGGWSMALTDALGGPTTCTIAAGTYYHSSDGSLSITLPEQIALAANTVMGETWTCTVAAGESASGKYTLGCSGATCTVTFTDSELRDLLGFTGDLSGSTSYLSPSQAQGLWLASQGYQKKNGGVGGSWKTDQQSTVTASGHVYSVVGRKYRHTSIIWPMETRAKCWAENETTTNESFEQFLIDGIWAGASWGTSTGPLRFYPDADTDATFGTFSALGLEEWDPVELVEHFAGGRWQIVLPRLIEVPG